MICVIFSWYDLLLFSNKRINFISCSRTLQSSSLITTSLRTSTSVNRITSENTNDITLCSICSANLLSKSSFGVPVDIHIINLLADRSTASSYCLLSPQIRNALSSLSLSSLINASCDEHLTNDL
jgi:hypothetical protein